MASARNELDVAQLVAEHHEGMYRYAYRLTGSMHDAEDLTQQAFLAAQRKIGQIRKKEHAKTWLFSTLRNCYLKSRLRRRPILAGDMSLKLERVPSPPAAEAADYDPLQAALNGMPEMYRLVLVMFYFEDCSYREIARRLEMPIGTVMSRLSRAREGLRSILSEPEGNPRKRPAGMAGQ